MPFVKVNPKEDKKKLLEENPELKSEFEIVDKEFSLLKEAIEYRKKEKVTQEEIAQKSGLCQQSISRIENLGVEPTLRNFIKYIDAAGLQLILQKKSHDDGKEAIKEVACVSS
jgi:DNA-binding XRE family transcriptional regulator